MTSRLRRAAAVAAVLVAILAYSAPTAPAAEVRFSNWIVFGNLHLKKLNQDVVLPRGSAFNGVLDTTTGRLIGHVTVPRFTSRLIVLGAVPADATIDLVEAAPASARVVLGGTTTIDGEASAFVYIRRLQSPLLPLNLVSGQCRTSAPLVLPLHYSGPPDFVNGFTFRGTTTIPALRGCGLSTPLLTLFMSGPDNRFSITIKPPPAG
jgi:hypothetical protein